MYDPRNTKLKRVCLALGVATLVLAVLLVFSLRALHQQKTAAREALAELESAPAVTIDGEQAMRLAEQYGVSTEYLQLLLPDYIVYRDAGSYVFAPLDPAVPLHSYDWSRLTYYNHRTQYRDERFADVCYGVDVSVYQKEIDWNRVAADGVSFAMVRIGYRGYTQGLLFQDEYAEANLQGALDAGLDVGAYFFSQAVTVEEAEAEADLVISVLDGYNVAYPVAFDMEEINDAARTDTLTDEERTDIAIAFCQRIADAGYTPMIYGNLRWLVGRLQLNRLTAYPIWFAQYYDHPVLPYFFTMWQYTSSGRVDGIPGDVDLNICFTQYGR